MVLVRIASTKAQPVLRVKMLVSQAASVADPSLALFLRCTSLW